MKSNKGFAPILIVLLVAVVIGGGAYYAVSKNKIDTPKQENNTPVNYFTIPELGIKFKVPDDIKDLDYQIQKSPGTAWISTKTLAAKEKWCDADYAALGSIIVTGTKPERVQESDIQERNGKYIHYTHPQATCSDDKEIQDLTIQQIAALREALKSVEVISEPTAKTEVKSNTAVNWKTYTNAEIGFSFNYPSTWKVVRGSDDTIYIKLIDSEHPGKEDTDVPANVILVKKMSSIDTRNVAQETLKDIGIWIEGGFGGTFNKTVYKQTSLKVEMVAINAESKIIEDKILATFTLSK